jgi:hypothetical protein
MLKAEKYWWCLRLRSKDSNCGKDLRLSFKNTVEGQVYVQVLMIIFKDNF